MCIADTVGRAVAAQQDRRSSRPDSLLIADRDSEDRPVGIGGRRRERDIDALVSGANTGLQIPQ